MAMLYVKTPNGTTKSINIETMNIVQGTTNPGDYANGAWYSFPSGMILQAGYFSFIADQLWHTNILPIDFKTGGYSIVASTTFREFTIQISIYEGWSKSKYVVCGYDFVNLSQKTYEIAVRWIALGY